MGRRAAEAVRHVAEYDDIDADDSYEEDGLFDDSFRFRRVSIPELLAHFVLPLSVVLVIEHAVANGATLSVGPRYGVTLATKSVVLAWPPSAAATRHGVASVTIADLLNAIATSTCCRLERCFGYEVWFLIEDA